MGEDEMCVMVGYTYFVGDFQVPIPVIEGRSGYADDGAIWVSVSALWDWRECTRYCVLSQALQLAVFHAEVAVSRSPFFQHRCGMFFLSQV